MQHLPTFLGASVRSCSIPAFTARATKAAIFLSLVLMTCLMCSGIDNAPVPQTNPAIFINPTVGPPTTNLTVAGSGFDPYAVVDIYFDIIDVAVVTTNGAGDFCGASFQQGIAIQVPASAAPGTHWITAVERHRIKAAQRPFLVRTDWAEFQFDPSQAGWNPYENVVNPSNATNLTLRWNYRTDAAIPSAPIVAGGYVYFGSNDGNVYAVNAHTGALHWQYTTGGAVESSPAVANGAVFVGSDDGNLYALNTSTGAFLWNYSTALGSSSPTVANGTVYVGGDRALGLNASSGQPVWQCDCELGTGAFSPAVVNGVAYVVAYGDDALYGVNASTGQCLWFSWWEYYTASTSPAVSNGVVYFASAWSSFHGNAFVQAYPIWWYLDSSSGFESPAAVANGVAYIGSSANPSPPGILYAFDATRAALLWQYTMGPDGIQSPAAVANGVLYIGYDNNLYALNASTGEVLWTYTTGGNIASSLAVADGMVYVASSDGNLYAFGLPSDELAKEFSPPERPDPRQLVPDLSLRPSTPVTTPSNPQPTRH
jgi:outer membrane protein assembly factor BamB